MQNRKDKEVIAMKRLLFIALLAGVFSFVAGNADVMAKDRVLVHPVTTVLRIPVSEAPLSIPEPGPNTGGSLHEVLLSGGLQVVVTSFYASDPTSPISPYFNIAMISDLSGVSATTGRRYLANLSIPLRRFTPGNPCTPGNSCSFEVPLSSFLLSLYTPDTPTSSNLVISGNPRKALLYPLITEVSLEFDGAGVLTSGELVSLGVPDLGQ
jgi:hypothetical protein